MILLRVCSIGVQLHGEANVLSAEETEKYVLTSLL